MDGYGDVSVFHIARYDNDAELLVAENDAANQWNPGLYSRMDWVWLGTALYFCQSVFDAADADAAWKAPAPDDSDPDNGGCGGFAWSQLIPR
jgi:hypothetical protein